MLWLSSGGSMVSMFLRQVVSGGPCQASSRPARRGTNHVRLRRVTRQPGNESGPCQNGGNRALASQGVRTSGRSERRAWLIVRKSASSMPQVPRPGRNYEVAVKVLHQYQNESRPTYAHNEVSPCLMREGRGLHRSRCG